MNFIESIDQFLMQLVIVPIVVIGLGVLSAVTTKRIFVGPLVTLILNLLYEVWYAKYYYPDLEISFTSWNIYFPIISLVISGIFISARKTKPKESH
ncbi:MAG: hypothetical protein ACQEWU_00420 [Bacillota bacterium]|uniref:Uncharacterized protein n=1 Tax=Virgibacillus salarius TaxID=447199 RepID=A0A941I9M8_9BACI|nr:MULTISPECIES: hypothetical protein [Bacillaceae]MBR7794491.1 hypothetical protein [Virgibacillus salarius]MDY7043285.1 hypothetical protein [Virgibacillus sp. M23]NAZ07213.1 hypothetical protein [Agaribacter marinus]WBX78783.1 hypothetical protein PD280_13075 [Virgibacillus salarius]